MLGAQDQTNGATAGQPRARGRQRPTFPLDSGDEEALRRGIRFLNKLEENALSDSAQEGSAYLRVLRQAARLSRVTGETHDRDVAMESCDRVLARLPFLSVEDLCRWVTERGSKAPDNIRMRNACYLFALRYALANDADDARYAARLLASFGEKLPQWPLYDFKGNPHPQTGPDFYTEWDHNGLWGTWIYSDCNEGYWLAEAYELVLGSVNCRNSRL